jgi:hypothetical protein
MAGTVPTVFPALIAGKRERLQAFRGVNCSPYQVILLHGAAERTCVDANQGQPILFGKCSNVFCTFAVSDLLDRRITDCVKPEHYRCARRACRCVAFSPRLSAPQSSLMLFRNGLLRENRRCKRLSEAPFLVQCRKLRSIGRFQE